MSLPDPERLQGSISAAVEYLQRSQLPHGEFRTWAAHDEEMAGWCFLDPSPFVTTFVLYALDFVTHPDVPEMQRKARDFLIAEMVPPGLWAYWTSRHFKTIDPDLDDTSCASFALRGHHPEIDRGANREIVLGNRNEEGVFQTWIREPGAKNDIDSGVNANVLLCLGERRETRAACEYLNRVIADGRESESYCYYLDDMSLYYMISRACYNGVHGLEESGPRIVERTLSRQAPDGSFGDAWLTGAALCVLLNYGLDRRDVLGAAASTLLSRQRDDGAWPRRAFYAGPEPPEKHVVWFGSEELTTAFCIEALARLAELWRRK